MALLIFLFFADSLYKEGDYFNAITEYKRMLFLKIGDKKDIYYKIGKSYEKMGNLEKSLYYYGKYYFLEDNPSDTFLLRYSYLFFKAEKYEEGISILKTLKESKERNFLISYGYLKIDSLKKYLKYLPDKSLYKNENLFRNISLILPGFPIILTGHITEGLASLFMNLFSGYLIYKNLKEKDYFSLSISIPLFIRFYTGNYEATKNYVRIYNEKKIKEKIKKFLH